MPYMLFSLTLAIPWLIVCGSQYASGTDYFSYMDTFTTGDVGIFYNKNEFLFAKIVEIYHKMDWPPQGLYFIFYAISFLFFFLTCYKLNNRYIFIFILLYFCVSNLFNNQLNGLRQSVATYIITYAALCLNDRHGRLRFLILIIFGSLFHASSWFALILIVFNSNRINIHKQLCRILLIVSLLLTIGGSGIINFLFDVLNGFIPGIYTHLLEGSFNQSIGIIGMIPKLILFPLYYRSTRFLTGPHTPKEKRLYKIGIICYMLRLMSIQNIILDRLGYIFVLLSVFPLFLYWTTLLHKKKNLEFTVSIFIPITLFLMKVIVLPEKEYLYNSVIYETFSIL